MKRQPAQPPCLFVSQHNCLAVVGMHPRTYLDFIRAERLPVAIAGKCRLVEADMLVEVLRARAVRKVTEPDSEGTDRGLAMVGRRLVG